MTIEMAGFTIHEGAEAVNSVPECAAWFRHIAESRGLRHVDVVAAWPAVPSQEHP